MTDEKEGRYIMVTDIPGAFLQADMEQDVHILLKGTIADLIVKLEPCSYRKFVWRNKHGNPMLYVKPRKALYGTLQAALLFWRLLSDTLIDWGFKLNDYDKCVSNKKSMASNVNITCRNEVVEHIINKLNCQK